MTSVVSCDDDLVAVSGHVHGVVIHGFGPPGLAALLRPLPGLGPPLAARVAVSFRRMARLPIVEELWSWQHEGATGERFSLTRLDEPPGLGLLVDHDGGGFYRIGKDGIEVEYKADSRSAAAFLVSHALPLWLENGGVPVLHASAVTFGDLAVAFLGPSGIGKSTLAAELVQQGCGFVADDGLSLRSGGDGIWRCFPGPPVCRLWPSALRLRLGLAPSELDRLHAGTEKRSWPVQVGDTAAVTGLTLAGIYLVGRQTRGEAEVSIRPSTRRSSLAHLIEHSVAAGPTAALGLSASRLDLLARVVEAVPIRRLELPSGRSGEPVARALSNDLTKLGRSGPSAP